MAKRATTDRFIKGAARIINPTGAGRRVVMHTRGLNGDWNAVGNDLRAAMAKTERRAVRDTR